MISIFQHSGLNISAHHFYSAVWPPASPTAVRFWLKRCQKWPHVKDFIFLTLSPLVAARSVVSTNILHISNQVKWDFGEIQFTSSQLSLCVTGVPADSLCAVWMLSCSLFSSSDMLLLWAGSLLALLCLLPSGQILHQHAGHVHALSHNELCGLLPHAVPHGLRARQGKCECLLSCSICYQCALYSAAILTSYTKSTVMSEFKPQWTMWETLNKIIQNHNYWTLIFCSSANNCCR